MRGRRTSPAGPDAARRERRTVATVGLVVLALLATVLSAVPGTSGAFVASVRNTASTASTAADFGRTTDELPYRSTFATGVPEWTTYYGCWKTMTAQGFGLYHEDCGGLGGNKAVTGRAEWTDYTMQADVKIDEGQQAGLITRVSGAGEGTDVMTGYYAYVTIDDKLELGRMLSGRYELLATVPIVSGIELANWYHLVVQMKGCTITVSQAKVGASELNGTTSLSYVDRGCQPTSGMVGLREYDAKAAWRFVTVTGGSSASRTPAPWNTPWSTGEAKGFTPYGGAWTVDPAAETYSNAGAGKGQKSVETTRTWRDLTLTGEVRFDAASSSLLDAGFNVRVRNPGVGTDQLDGYYGGISRTHLVIGRHDGGTWSEFVRTPLVAPAAQGQWHHLTVEMVGCRLTVTAQATAGGAPTRATHLDTGCSTEPGGVGVRTLAIPASFRSTAVTPR